jgi:tetratricopeptide (TPR) repeat protein
MTIQASSATEALTILEQAVPIARSSNNKLTLCRTLASLGLAYILVGKPDHARVTFYEGLALARDLDDLSRELLMLQGLGIAAKNQDDFLEAERLLTEVYTRAVAVGNRYRAMTARNNLGEVAYERGNIALAHEYWQQSLALAHEIGAQAIIAMGLMNLAVIDIQLGDWSAARAKLREGLASAMRLGAPVRLVVAMVNFGELAYAEGQTERALMLLGLARSHPAWDSDFQRSLDMTLAKWELDASVAGVGMAKGAQLDWDKTIEELLKG